MHAIIVTGGKQYKVAEGEAVFIEKLPAEAGDQVVFDQVLAILDGDNAAIGTPVVSGAKVEAKVVKNGKGKKVRIFKYNPPRWPRSSCRPPCRRAAGSRRRCRAPDISRGPPRRR